MKSEFALQSVAAITQTKDGYIWLGTLNGLIRFDGIRFKAFRKGSPDSIKGNVVRSLLEDRKGNLWIGTQSGGLTCLKDGKFTTFSIDAYPQLKEILSLFEDSKGNLWIGTSNNGLTCLRNQKFYTYQKKNGLPSNRVRAFWENEQGWLWIATSSGISIYEENKGFSIYTNQQGTFEKYIISMCHTWDNSLWLGCLDGLYRLKNNQISKFGNIQGLKVGKIKHLLEDRHHNLWVGTEDGLFRIKEDRFESLSTADGLSSKLVYALHEDQEGNIWIGTIKGGLHRLRDTVVTPFTNKEGLVHDIVNSISYDAAGQLWFGTEGGISRLNINGVFFNLRSGKELPNNSVKAVLKKKNGNLWFSTASDLYQYRQNRYIHYKKLDETGSNFIRELTEDRHGSILVLSTSYLGRIDQGNYNSIVDTDYLLSRPIMCFLKDKEDHIWLGTNGNGLIKLENNTHIVFTDKEGLVHNEIECIYQDEVGVIYVGTRGGLSMMVGKKIFNITTQNGLIDSHVKSIVEDNLQHLWLSGRTCVLRIKKQELKDFITGKINTIHPAIFNENDGFKDPWFNQAVRTLDGKLWFTTDKGVVMIDPRDIKERKPPPVVLEEMIIDGEVILAKKKTPILQLPPGTQRLEFYYTAPDYYRPGQIKFKHKLTGYDQHWVKAGLQRSTTYTNLPPGEYTFSVTAENGNGVWNPIGASFPFYIKPYFYQTIWFYFSAILTLLIFIFLFHRHRISKLRTREKELASLVEERTLDLKEKNLELGRAKDQLEQNHIALAASHKRINDSVNYASKIQQAVLPSLETLNKFFPNHFLIYKPCSVVSGDFYWLRQIDDKILISASDCTGHGVPGALLSMLGMAFLNEIVPHLSAQSQLTPANILDQLRLDVKNALKQQGNLSDQKEGMDIALSIIDPKTRKLQFAGAQLPLYLIRDNQLVEVKGDRMPIGIHRKQQPFTNHDIAFLKNDMIYLFSDGYADQLSEKTDEKFMKRNFKKLLLDINQLPVEQQKEALIEHLDEWIGDSAQVDDILILGIRLY